MQVTRLARGALETTLGFLQQGLRPAKQTVVIYSAMRSGSTLLKALLGTKPDISHLPEVRYEEWPRNRHAFRYRLGRIADEPIVVLKKPCFFNQLADYPVIPPVLFLPVVIIRNPVDTALSLARRVREKSQIRRGFETYGKSHVEFWCEVYRNIHEGLTAAGLRPHVVFYEQLMREPEAVTQRLFERIGSGNTDGVRTYAPYGEWRWGNDDAGQRIQSLTVLERPRADGDETQAILAEVRATKCAAEVMGLYRGDGVAYHDYLRAGGHL